MRMQIDLGAVLLVAVVGGCAYVEDKNAAPHHQDDRSGPTLPPVAPGRLRPLSANFALFPEPGDEMAALDQEVIAVKDGDVIPADRFTAPDHLEVTFAPAQGDLGGERTMRVDLPDGAEDEVEVTSDKCWDYRPTYDSHGCIVVLKAAKTLPAGAYRLTVSYAADAERSMAFTVAR